MISLRAITTAAASSVVIILACSKFSEAIFVTCQLTLCPVALFACRLKVAIHISCFPLIKDSIDLLT
jgi:hypothetical protein